MRTSSARTAIRACRIIIVLLILIVVIAAGLPLVANHINGESECRRLFDLALRVTTLMVVVAAIRGRELAAEMRIRFQRSSVAKQKAF